VYTSTTALARISTAAHSWWRMNCKLLHRVNPRYIGVPAIILLALSAAATASADTKTITFDHDSVICGTKLPAGDYTLFTENGHLAVKVERKIVAACAAHWEASSDAPSSNSVLYGDNDKVIEIRFAHERGVLIVAMP
jgi:hypothetical protein